MVRLEGSVMQIDSETGIIATVVGSVIAVGAWVGRIGQRVTALEDAYAKSEKSASIIADGLLRLSTSISATREDMMRDYAPIRHIISMEEQIKEGNDKTSAMAERQAEHGAMLRGMMETLKRLESKS